MLEHPDFSSTGPRPSSPSPATRASWATVPRTTSTSPPTIPAAPPLTPIVRRRSRPSSRSSSGSRRRAGPSAPTPGATSAWTAALWSPCSGTPSAGRRRWAPWWAPPTSCSTPRGRPTGRLALHRPGVPVSPRARLPHLRQRGHQLLLLHQEGHFRRHLRPAPPGRHHPAPFQRPVLAILRRKGYHGCNGSSQRRSTGRKGRATVKGVSICFCCPSFWWPADGLAAPGKQNRRFPP